MFPPQIWAFIVPLFAFFFSLASASPFESHQHVKRSTQVSLVNFSYSNNVLSGSINIQNIAYTKVVTVVYAVGNSWSDSQAISAGYIASGSNNYETWSFSGTAPGATQFYIKYTVSGQTYYDPGNNVNYQISTTTSTTSRSTTALPTSSTTTTTTTKVTTSSSTIVSTSTSSAPPPTGTVSPGSIPPIIPSNIPSEAPATAPSGCGNFNGLDSCVGNAFDMVPSSEKRRWQTPPRGDPAYQDSFQDYSHLIGYADIQYNSARNAAVVTVNAASKNGATLTYNFGGTSQTSPTFQVTNTRMTDLEITVTSSDGKKLVLEPLNFVWQNPGLDKAQASFDGGQKGAIVELFGWPWNDVAKECVFLGKAGYMGVKVWAPNEHVWGSNYYETDGQFRPWYHLYQPVSYRLQSRLGTRAELRAMLNACRSAGVRVYADAVINHMSGQGTDIQNHRDASCNLYSGHNGTSSSPYYTSGNTFLINPSTSTRPTLEFPAVPYGPTDFHCERTLNDWNSGDIITKGWLVGLTDLNTEKPYVQDRIATYLTDLLSIGFSGFRVDAAKHIGPASMAAIFARLKRKMGGGEMMGDFVTWLEVIIGGEKDLMACGGGEWSWYENFDTLMKREGLSGGDVEKVKIWSSDYPKEMPICGSWIIPPSRFAIQNDDHDQQNDGSSSRDMGDKGSVLIKDKDVPKHRSFEIQLFTRTDNDWHIKLILSSYQFSSSGGNGFPDGLSDCSMYYTGTQPVGGCKGIGKDEAFVDGACGYMMGMGRYTRVHRDLGIVNAMRGWVGLGVVSAGALGIPGCT